ncbi:MAG: type II toxin-antitoxin system RelE/ParE family toxin [Dehalococcoidia bacterium]
MRVRYANEHLRRLATDKTYRSKLPPEIIRAYRKAINFLEQCSDEREIRAWKGSHFEKFKDHHSIRLNRQFRLELAFEGEGNLRVAVILSAGNYHGD